MSYIIKLQLRDTTREFPTETARNNAFTVARQKLQEMGIPDRNIILSKIDNDTCSLGHDHETVVERVGE